MDNIIAIYGKSCCLKTDVAQELSLMTGFKLTNRGEKATTEAKYTRVPVTAELPESFHRQLDAETLSMTEWNEKLMIFESAFMDAVLAGKQNVFLVRLYADDSVREQRWKQRKEEGGGRTRQLGESVAARDREDETLRRKLYGANAPVTKPALDIDSSKRSAVDVARQIWETFEAEAGIEVITNKPAMDKAAARGIFPGPTTGVVTRFTAKETPFGGYIRDDRSGQEIYVHKSAVGEVDNGVPDPGMKVTFEIVADSFGGFKALKVRTSP
jgi:cytidylate kinase/cold shock CspA family protein